MTSSERLAPYVTNLDRPVYAIHGLPPEVVAVLFALVSRSPAGFRENLLTLMEEDRLPIASPRDGDTDFDQSRASAFHEKWVLGYGHSSVAEHATLHFALEGLSILAAKAVEDARLAAFTEKSSRYQVFDLDHFHWPAEWEGDPDEGAARALVAELFAAYGRVYQELKVELGQAERPAGLGQRAWQQTLHAAACDAARYLLPAGARTSLGMTINARGAAHLARKLRCHELAEVRELGDRLEEEGCQVTPVLLKHSQPGDWQRGLRGRLAAALPRVGGETEVPPVPRVRLVDWDRDAEERIVADWLVQVRGGGLDQARRRAAALGERRGDLLRRALDGLGEHEALPRAFEQVMLTVEFCLDYGAFRDLQRHRLLTPTVPALGCRWGWELPEALASPARRAAIEVLLERVAGLWKRLASRHEAAASYLVPLAFRQRFVMRMNLREAAHLIHLRSAPAGHLSYRSAAQDLHRQLVVAWPLLGALLRVNRDGAAWAREKELQRGEISLGEGRSS